MSEQGTSAPDDRTVSGVSSKMPPDISFSRGHETGGPKALALLSGGLDSILATRLMLDQGVEVEGVNFTTPFCLCDKCSVESFGNTMGIRIHKIFLGQEFLDVVSKPIHGYGSQMNPCLDCRILMFKKAKELAEKMGADFLVTGEVLDERPFSQRKEKLLLIEREAGIKGRVVRPLSAKLLPETDPEREGLINREKLLAIRGRGRVPQMELARRLGLNKYPNPAGGCLLTDPRFAERLREHLNKEKILTLRDAALLKLGRHFRVDGTKVVVGRNEEENRRLLAIAETYDIPYFETVECEGPRSLLVGEEKPKILEKAAAITARYSDAPKDSKTKVLYKGKKERIIETQAERDEELARLRI